MKLDLGNTNWEEGAMLLVDKPLDFTSFQAVNKIKYILKKPKIGHSGTLDPLATGLLILCTGKWTKKLTELTGLSKEYTGSITLGATTPTFDLESEPENIKSLDGITESLILKTTEQFIGAIEQFPPIYSAIKQNGKPIYKAARNGEEVIVKVRNIVITEFEITKIDLPKVYFRVACGSGTYIRSLANDFGAVLNVGGYLSNLRRTKIGDYKVDDALTMDEFIAFGKKDS
jgi:tRNA pseudouridine55 synthase